MSFFTKICQWSTSFNTLSSSGVNFSYCQPIMICNSGHFGLFLLLLIKLITSCVSFNPTTTSKICTQHASSALQQEETTTTVSPSVSILQQDTTYIDSFRVIDECASSGIPSDNLYDCVRYIDKKAFKLYPNDDAKIELWDRAHGVLDICPHSLG